MLCYAIIPFCVIAQDFNLSQIKFDYKLNQSSWISGNLSFSIRVFDCDNYYIGIGKPYTTEHSIEFDKIYNIKQIESSVRTFSFNSLDWGVSIYLNLSDNNDWIELFSTSDLISADDYNTIIASAENFTHNNSLEILIKDGLLEINSTETITSLTIYNISGLQSIKSKPLTPQISFDISILNQGIYILEIDTIFNKKHIKKIII